MSARNNWEHFNKFYFDFPSIGLSIDLSKMNFPAGFFETMEPRMQKAFAEMEAAAAAGRGRGVANGQNDNAGDAPQAAPQVRRSVLSAVDTFA